MSEFAGYEAAHEERMRLYGRSLPEDHRRRHAALEAVKIGLGGVAYVARVLGMSRRTVSTRGSPTDPLVRWTDLKPIQLARELVVSGVAVSQELLGTLHRSGPGYSTAQQRVYDHDYRHLASGLLVPHGIYDVVANHGFIILGTSHDTSAFACDALFLGWTVLPCHCDPTATEVRC
jgi:hypothetical protein